MDQAILKYNTSLTVTLDVLAVRGASEPDKVSKFPGLTFNFLDGSIAEQVKGGRREISLQFQVMTAAQRRQIVLWWLDPDRIIKTTMTQPTGENVTLESGGSLTEGSTYQYRVSAIDVIGEGQATAAQSTGAIGASNKTASFEWNAVTGARRYKVYRRKDSDPWQVMTYVEQGATMAYNDAGTGTAIVDQDPPDAADEINLIVPDDLEFEWGYGTELVRLLTINGRDAVIFASEDGFPV